MRLIVGLGNPGAEYERTRHNAGFMVLDRLAQRLGIATPAGGNSGGNSGGGGKAKFHGLLMEASVAGERCGLLKPMTYMNRSGLAVGEAVAFYKLERKDILVVVDDVALPVGRIRLRGEGSPGGHNGLADIQRALGAADYPRLRIGIDAPGMIPQVDYVLGRFTAAQMTKLDSALDLACGCVETWITYGLNKAMTQFNAGE